MVAHIHWAWCEIANQAADGPEYGLSAALRQSLVGTYMCYSWLLDGPMLLIYIGPTWSQGLNLYGLRLVHGWPSEFLWVAMIQVHELWLPLTLFVIILLTYHKQVSKQHMIVINLVRLAFSCLLFIITPLKFWRARMNFTFAFSKFSDELYICIHIDANNVYGV